NECPPPSALVPTLPKKLDRIILRCLEKNRERRYLNVAELVEDLAPLVPAGARSAARVARLSARVEDSISAGAVSSDPAAAQVAARRGPGFMIGLGAALSITILSCAFLIGR